MYILGLKLCRGANLLVVPVHSQCPTPQPLTLPLGWLSMTVLKQSAFYLLPFIFVSCKLTFKECLVLLFSCSFHFIPTFIFKLLFYSKSHAKRNVVPNKVVRWQQTPLIVSCSFTQDVREQTDSWSWNQLWGQLLFK